MTGGELVIRCLLEQGVGTAFGIPGALNASLYDALPKFEGRFRHVLVRHELGGGWMADGYARAGGDVGCALVVPGPGATHIASAVAGAYTECSRLLLIAAESATQWRGELRRDLFHGLDQARIYAPITKWSVSVTKARQIPEALEEAFYHLRRDRPGPVYVGIPADVYAESVPDDTPIPARVEPIKRTPDDADIAAAVKALRSASKPLIYAGDGVLHSEASGVLGEVAELLGAPVTTTVMGKGALPEDHPWSLGDSNNVAGSVAYPEADLIFAVGARFNQLDTRWPWFRPPERLVHVDADAREINRLYRAEVGLVGDVRLTLEQLAAALREEGGSPADGWRQRLPGLKQALADHQPWPMLGKLRDFLPREALASFDVCYPGFLSRMDWPTLEPRSWFYPGVYVGMGFGLPIGIGAKLACPEKPVMVVAGDGGFQMTLPELGTAAQLGLPLLVVVSNDAGLTLIRRIQDRDYGGRRVEVDLKNPDFVALARAYGIDAHRATNVDELGEILTSKVDLNRLTLVEFQNEAPDRFS